MLTLPDGEGRTWRIYRKHTGTNVPSCLGLVQEAGPPMTDQSPPGSRKLAWMEPDFTDLATRGMSFFESDTHFFTRHMENALARIVRLERLAKVTTHIDDGEPYEDFVEDFRQGDLDAAVNEGFDREELEAMRKLRECDHGETSGEVIHLKPGGVALVAPAKATPPICAWCKQPRPVLGCLGTYICALCGNTCDCAIGCTC